jgi:drug/metabolite transporter (DMT)-like permease
MLHARHSLRYATMLALATAAISGASNFLNKIAVSGVRDPVLYTTLKNVLVALVLIGVIAAGRQWRTIAALSRRDRFLLLAVGAVGGSLPFALFFTGLTTTSALNAALIHKTLILWVALLAIPLLRERVSSLQWLGIAALFAANLIVGGFTGFRYNTGEFLILIATILWACENVIAKIALRNIPSTIVAAARMMIGSLILLAIVLMRNPAVPASIFNLTATQWVWVLATSALLCGYVLTWYRALSLAPATYVATLLLPATLVTNALTAIFLTHTFATGQILSASLMVVGAGIVIAAHRRQTAELHHEPAS